MDSEQAKDLLRRINESRARLRRLESQKRPNQEEVEQLAEEMRRISLELHQHGKDVFGGTEH